MLFDQLSPGLDVVAHEEREDGLGLHPVLNGQAPQAAALRVECGLP